MVWTWGQGPGLTKVKRHKKSNLFFSTREIRGEDTQVRMTCRKPRGDLAILFFFLRIQGTHGIHHHSSPPCVEYVCLQPTKKQIQAIETRKVVATGCLCLTRFQRVTLDISNGKHSPGLHTPIWGESRARKCFVSVFSLWSFLCLSYSCTPGPTELKQLLTCEPPNVGSNMCSGGMFEDGLGVQERPFLQLQIGGGSIHAFFFSPILAHDCPFGETLTYGSYLS